MWVDEYWNCHCLPQRLQMAAGANATETQIEEFLKTVPWRTLKEVQKEFTEGLLMTPVGINGVFLAANPVFPEDHSAKKAKKNAVCTLLCMDCECNTFFIEPATQSVVDKLTIHPGCEFKLYPCR